MRGWHSDASTATQQHKQYIPAAAAAATAAAAAAATAAAVAAATAAAVAAAYPDPALHVICFFVEFIGGQLRIATHILLQCPPATINPKP